MEDGERSFVASRGMGVSPGEESCGEPLQHRDKKRSRPLPTKANRRGRMGAEFGTPRRRALANSGTFTVSGSAHAATLAHWFRTTCRHSSPKTPAPTATPLRRACIGRTVLGAGWSNLAAKAANTSRSSSTIQALLPRSTPACLAVMTVRPSPLIGHTAPIRRRLITHPHTPPGSAGRGFGISACCKNCAGDSLSATRALFTPRGALQGVLLTLRLLPRSRCRWRLQC